jgi:hypothetical protein
MTDPRDIGQPPQRRDNGLVADRYVALADVDPRLGEHLLDLLRLADIPAYLEPPADPRVAARYRVAGPIERLYVQSALRAEAREVVVAAAAEAGPPMVADDSPELLGSPDTGKGLLDGVDTDAEFARIVAGFNSTADEPRLSGPVDWDARSEVTASMLDAAAEQRAALDRERADLDDDPALLEEHFEPPPPPPFPWPSPGTLGALLIFLLGLFIIARGDLIGLGGDVAFPLGVISVLTGLGLLVSRLRPRADESDDDDGAIV